MSHAGFRIGSQSIGLAKLQVPNLSLFISSRQDDSDSNEDQKEEEAIIQEVDMDLKADLRQQMNQHYIKQMNSVLEFGRMTRAKAKEEEKRKAKVTFGPPPAPAPPSEEEDGGSVIDEEDMQRAVESVEMDPEVRMSLQGSFDMVKGLKLDKPYLINMCADFGRDYDQIIKTKEKVMVCYTSHNFHDHD